MLRNKVWKQTCEVTSLKNLMSCYLITEAPMSLKYSEIGLQRQLLKTNFQTQIYNKINDVIYHLLFVTPYFGIHFQYIIKQRSYKLTLLNANQPPTSAIFQHNNSPPFSFLVDLLGRDECSGSENRKKNLAPTHS